MSIYDENDRAIMHALQVKKIQNHIKEQVEKVKMDAFTAREELIQRRAEKIEQVRQKLNDTTLSIIKKHELIKERLNQEAVFREANIRVNRGLEALEKFIQILRDTEMEDEMLKKAIRDPIISSSMKSEARKIITSEFFQSIQKQLIMQTEFINIAAHELRTPIMPILVNVELLTDRLGSDNDEIKIIVRNAKRLQRLTENILSVTRIESKSLALKKEVFDINSLIENVIKDESAHIENNKVSIIVKNDGHPINIEADRDRMAQVISNFLNNAIKFTKDGTITISSRVQDGNVIVNIKDNGPGIDRQIIPILFAKFVTKSDKGTGLGLYICKSIIEVHGGVIGAENSSDGIGAIFSFSLPIKI
ncbi:MAG TPA: HAMP domain-containing sensor histidine kinase [Candidatus Nitrosotalea sp.]|nr:HAMP domain-containing sensor histidine kinase [Candidatus Nitrosotalea sp.]